MENQTDGNPQVFLNDVADAMDAAASQFENQTNGAPSEITTTSSQLWQPKFGQKLVYSTCYSISFGVCFPVFLACRYVPKNNALVQGMIAGGSAATADVDAWLARINDAKKRASETGEATSVSEVGAEALAPA